MTTLYDVPRYYDLLYTANHAVDHYVELAAARGGEVLELACGSGRLTLPLAARGLAVTGLDQSAAMLAAGRDKAARANLAVTWIEGDMARFELGRRFETIILPHNSLLHLLRTEDLLACFACVRAHLAPGGCFAFDIFNPSVELLARPRDRRRAFGKFDDPIDGTVIAEATPDYDAAAQVNRATVYFSAPGRPDFHVVPLHLRSIFPQELPLLVDRAGLVLESRHGDFAGGELTSASPHQVCRCSGL